MYIEDRLFSETSDEVFYSVVMNEDEFLLYQKEFGVVSDLVHSGVKRTAKKYIGRIRTKMARPFYKSAIESSEKASKAVNDFSAVKSLGTSAQTVKNTKKNVGKLAGKHNARINDIKGMDSGVCETGALNESITENYRESPFYRFSMDNSKKGRKMFRNLRSGKHKQQILYDKNRPVVELAHEIGHLENQKKSKVVSHIANNPNVRSVIKGDINNLQTQGNNGRSGIKDILGLAGIKSIINREEKNATKRGLKVMKEAGATKEELERSKEHMKRGYDSYRHWQNTNLMTTIGNTINIPSRRNTSLLNEKMWK